MKNQVHIYKFLLFHIIAAVLIGIAVGAVDAVFGRILLLITDIRTAHLYIFVPFLPLAGLLILFLYQTISPKSMGGMGLIFDTGFQENERIPKRLVPLIIITTWITHLFGGSAGREGVAVQIGAAISHTAGKKLGVKNNARLYLLIGMAAGFAGLFQTPLAAVFFALEVMVTGSLWYEALLPCLAAAFTASYTAHLLGLEKFSVSITDTLSFTPDAALKFILTAISFGIIGGCFARLLAFAKNKLGNFIPNSYLRIFIIGICLSILLLLLHQGRYAGLGINLIQDTFLGEQIYPYDFLLKFGLTILTLAAGFQGGEVTPLFAIGCCAGALLGNLFGLPVLLTAALGYTAVFGSATNTLFAPVIIGMEVFGPQNALFFLIACSIAFACNGNQSIYGKQRLFPGTEWKQAP